MRVDFIYYNCTWFYCTRCREIFTERRLLIVFPDGKMSRFKFATGARIIAI